MSDESKLDKEATNFAFVTHNEDNLDLIRLSWEACATYIESVLKAECHDEASLQVLRKIINAD